MSGEARMTEIVPPPLCALSLSDLVRAIVERDQFACVLCGNYVAGGLKSMHHRVLGDRSVNEPWNLITLCGSGTTLCHGWTHGIAVASYPKPSRSEITDSGYIVSRHHKHPWLVPVWFNQPPTRDGYYLLGHDLTVTEYQPERNPSCN